MNICHIITTIERGGAENYVANLCKSQSKKNNVIVIYLKGKPYWKNFFLKNKITSFNINFDYNLLSLVKSIFHIKKIMEIEKIQILHAHLVAAEILAFFSLIFKKKKIKFFITKHLDNFWLNQSGKPYYEIFNLRSLISKLIEYIIIIKTDKVIAISKSVKKYLIDGLQVNKNKVKLVYYGINIPNKLDLVRKTKKIKKKKIIFGTISRLVEQKNIDLALDAFRLLHEKKYHFEYRILGKGILEKSLKNKVKNLNLTNQIKFYGYSDNPQIFLKNIDIFCLTSLYEGLGLVVLEAMIAKRLLVLSDAGALSELIKHNHNGISFKSDNLEDLLKNLEYSIKINNTKTSLNLINNSIILLKKEYREEINHNKIMAIYNNG